MIIYKLQCDSGHEFEGWFSDSSDYDQQQQRGILSCPLCSSHQVTKMLGGTPMLKSKPSKIPSNKSMSSGAPTKELHLSQAEMVSLVKSMHHYVKKNFENVGKKFYDEAVKMDNGEAPKRSICGEVTVDQKNKLDEKSINYALLPKLGPEFEN